jgi:hypothetical protein
MCSEPSYDRVQFQLRRRRQLRQRRQLHLQPVGQLASRRPSGVSILKKISRL